MGQTLVWISGASRGIGRALADAVPWPGARVINISRRPARGLQHLQADLAEPASWATVGASFRDELTGFGGDRVAFVHAAGTLEPIGFAGEVDTAAYTRNVLLNSAAPQVLGHLFLAAVRQVRAERHLVVLTSGAARSVYPGWSSYGAGKAAVDQWVRNAAAEQASRGGAHVLSVAPGVVETAMQQQMRETPEADFPLRQKFIDLYTDGKLADVDDVAAKIWRLVDAGPGNEPVVDLRQLQPGA